MAVNSEIASEQRQWNGIEEKRCNTAVPELHVCRRSGAEEGRRLTTASSTPESSRAVLAALSTSPSKELATPAIVAQVVVCAVGLRRHGRRQRGRADDVGWVANQTHDYGLMIFGVIHFYLRTTPQ
uniref:Uncharacterized protein n=1 Tax=Ficus carica TaxID=3494 RepID=A0AA88E3H9_FICCA|nr:hypothetical protein TIFTF001_036498 [Ficus carica]